MNSACVGLLRLEWTARLSTHQKLLLAIRQLVCLESLESSTSDTCRLLCFGKYGPRSIKCVHSFARDHDGRLCEGLIDAGCAHDTSNVVAGRTFSDGRGPAGAPPFDRLFELVAARSS